MSGPQHLAKRFGVTADGLLCFEEINPTECRGGWLPDAVEITESVYRKRLKKQADGLNIDLGVFG